MSAPIRVAIRGFVGHVRQFEDRIEVDMEHLDALPALAKKHASQMPALASHIIEIEFLDERDVNTRFFRYLIDPAARKVMPIQVKL